MTHVSGSKCQVFPETGAASNLYVEPPLARKPKGELMNASTERVRESRTKRAAAGMRRTDVWIVPGDYDAGMEAAADYEPCQPPPGVHAMSWVLGWVRGNEMRLGPSGSAGLKSENQEI